MKKLWVDDLRDSPDDSWDIARSYETALSALKHHEFDIVSLDHDLGQEDGKDGYGIVKWLAERKQLNKGSVPNEIRVHTANPVGRKNMESVIKRYIEE